MEAVVSTDCGDHWQVPQHISTGEFGPSDHPALTRSRILLRGLARVNHHYYVASGNRDGSGWTDFQTLPDPINAGSPFMGSVAADTGSEVALFLTSWMSPLGQDLYIHRSTGGGLTWAAPRALTEGGTIRSLDNSKATLFCRGKLWGLAFLNNQDDEHPETWALCWRFSANHGRDWYPPQRVDSAELDNIYTNGQFVGNHVRLYWNAVDTTRFPDSLFDDYRTVSGILTPDTTAPEIDTGIPLSDEIGQGSTVQFLATASDNDSLLLMQAVLKRRGSADSIVVPLSERVSPTDYRGTWTVPQDTALWTYYYRAEDMWENVSVFPDTGLFSFHTTGWSKADPRFIAHPSSFSVQVFPNPFNSVTRISFTVPKAGPVNVRVYDITGRLITTLANQKYTAGEHEVAFDGVSLASGIYFVRTQAGAASLVRKIMLV